MQILLGALAQGHTLSESYIRKMASSVDAEKLTKAGAQLTAAGGR
jgi:hypothetical protein